MAKRISQSKIIINFTIKKMKSIEITEGLNGTKTVVLNNGYTAVQLTVDPTSSTSLATFYAQSDAFLNEHVGGRPTTRQ